MKDPITVLKKYWGFEKFKPAQEAIIHLVLNNVNVVALLPTGGGKSLCFQLPALAQDGICLVISPLVALMQDQVAGLKQKGIKAMHLTSGITARDLDTALDNCIYGNYKFLYLSPERLQQDIVQERIKQMNVNLIAVDEAHCISQWGHDFRPAYQQIKLLHEITPQCTWIALSATATPQVVEDIKYHLNIPQAITEQHSFARLNIGFHVHHTQDKQYNLLNALETNPGTAIVYVNNRKATQELVEYLVQHEITATPYHGGIETNKKKERLNSWLAGTTRVMVATNAFGMGIDKSDVRLVVHYHIPSSIEGYFQEAGRAGRDGEPAAALLLYNEADTLLIKRQFLSAIPNVAEVKYTYKKIMSYFSVAYGEGRFETFDFNFYKFCQHYSLNTLKTYQILELLDRNSILRLSKKYAKKALLHIDQTSSSLMHYLRENRRYAHLLTTILRTYGGIFEQPIAINLSLIASKAAMQEKEVALQLNELHHKKQLTFENYIHDASLTLLMPREDDHSINPIIDHIESQLTHKKEQIDSVLGYLHRTDICRSVQLLHYFGEDASKSCGICSVCQGKEQEDIRLSSSKTQLIEQQIIAYLTNQQRTSREITEALAFETQEVLHTLQVLIEEKRILLTKTNTYSLSL